MKAILRIPTQEQYAYVELHIDDAEELEPNELQDLYAKYSEPFSNGVGLSIKEMKHVRDAIMGGTLTSEDWSLVDEKATKEQRYAINQIKLLKNDS